MPAAVVTGGSRGVGAEVVGLLAASGYQVTFCFREKARRAARVVSAAGPSRVTAVRADITTPEGRERLTAAATEHVDVLVLNAAGGMESTEVYAELLNADSQVALLDKFSERLGDDSVVIFPTSLQAHQFGDYEEFGAYLPVARSKHRGERLVTARCADLRVRCVVVVADMIDRSPAAILLDLREPEAAEERRRSAVASGLALPTTSDVAAGVVAGIDAHAPSVIHVAGAPLSKEITGVRQ